MLGFPNAPGIGVGSQSPAAAAAAVCVSAGKTHFLLGTLTSARTVLLSVRGVEGEWTQHGREGGRRRWAARDPCLGLLLPLQTEGVCPRRSLRPPPVPALSPPLLISNSVPCARGHT